ncbi:uncharacterized protein C6orf132-like [Penaeus japonicus]|uniref:uncharacterized protein C6orf132-like n=1 Tax=Penaeus japonicus TaxID=27405 RepID=UPI001C711602|nr:uncharacterized protein C6orf132-like [Penaeus japonicus]
MLAPRSLWALSVLLVGVASSEDRWVWGKSDTHPKASRIPGYVEPATPAPPPPPVTTFRPRLPPSEHQRQFKSITAHPFFLGPYPPFSFVPVGGPRGGPPAPPREDDGTTKSRVTADTAHDEQHGAVLDADDKYTTLDRLQSERGAPPPLPRPRPHQLGGLHPDEVFYADDDLLIIKGGGFNSDVFQDPPQTLDEDERYELEPSRLRPVAESLHDREYNGNVPAFLPPPDHQRPFSLFVEGASDNNHIYVPYVFPRPQRSTGRPATAPQPSPYWQPVSHYVYPVPAVPFYMPPASASLVAAPRPSPASGALTSNHLPEPVEDFGGGVVLRGHSLLGDTNVNNSPNLPINPLAETFRRRASRPRL